MKVKIKICGVLIVLLALMAIPAVSASSYYVIEDGSESNWIVRIWEFDAQGVPFLWIDVYYDIDEDPNQPRSMFNYPRAVKGVNGELVYLESTNQNIEHFAGYLQNIGGGYRELHLQFSYGEYSAEGSWVLPIGVGRWDFVEST